MRGDVFLRIVIFGVLFAGVSIWAQAKEKEWRRLHAQVDTLYRQGKYAKAIVVAQQALRVAERTFGTDRPAVATSLNNLAFLYEKQGQYAKAEPLFQRSLAIDEKALGPDHPDVGTSLGNLAMLYSDQGRYTLAEPLLLRALVIREKALGLDHPAVGTIVNNLGTLNSDQGRYTLAEPLLLRALVIREKALGPDHPDVAVSLNNLAVVYISQGRYAQAEPLHHRSLAIHEKVLGPDHPDVATSLSNLAMLYSDQRRYALAEPLLLRSLAIREKALGPDHPDVAVSLNNLAELFRTQRQYAKAEPLYWRAIAIWETALGPDHPTVGTSLNSLAMLYSDQGQYARAELLYQRSLAIHEKVLGPNHPDIATRLSNLAMLYSVQGRYPLVEPLLLRSLAIQENALGPAHPSVATSLNNLANLYSDQDRYTLGEPLYLRSLAIQKNALGPDHPSVATSLNNLAMLYSDQSRYALALEMSRSASAIYRQRILASSDDDAFLRESFENRGGFVLHLMLLSSSPEAKSILNEESLDIAQLTQLSGTASALAQMSARFASGNDEIALKVRQRQDLIMQIKALDDAVVNEIGKSAKERNTTLVDNLRTQLAAVKQKLAAADDEITQRFPAFKELSRPEPLGIAEAQALLRNDEALVTYVLSNKKSWAWVIRQKSANWFTLQADKASIEKLVSLVRARMNENCGDSPCPAELAALHELYNELIAPIASEISDVKNLLLVPDGGLQGLPFPMLVASPARHADDPARTDYTQVDWLARHHAVTVLPSTSSLRALRRFAKPGVGQEPFIGFGDPALDGAGDGNDPQSFVRGKRTVRKVALRGGVADPADIRKLEPLPATADELNSIAQSLKAVKDAVWLRERATEHNVKTIDLSRYRAVAFATHGQLAGSVKGSDEPGLIFTPPAQATQDNDGYLAASEVAQLKLRAEWVLLSACNTAAADGRPGAEGLSGLAKAFFYAGGKTLLVSHWPVDSEATVKLTTTMMRLHQDNASMSKAEAHRQSMLALMNDAERPDFAHPFFWAPFVVVGEGAR